MTHEERAKWIRWIFVLLLSAGVVGGAWFYQRKHDVKPAEVAEAPPQEFDLTIYHFHEPGNAASEELADHYNEITRKYGQVVLVKRIDVTARPLDAAKEGVEKAPKSVMAAGGKRVFEFAGVWPYPKLEQKIDQILRGLKRVDKDWRPEVKGMTRASSGEGTANNP